MSIKRILLLALSIAAGSLLKGQDIRTAKAKDFAEKFLLSKKSEYVTDPHISLQIAYLSPDTVPNKLYCFHDQQSGFVMVVQSGEGFVVTGYSADGIIDLTSGNPGLNDLIKLYEHTISFDSPAAAQSTAKGAASSGTPLLDIESINWGQDFNSVCPFDTDAGVNTLAGCVAVTMAQIMRYHKFPASGSGSHSYTHSKYGIISANFENTLYKWANMPGGTTTPNSYTDTLVFHAGVGAEMKYGVSESSAYVSKATTAFNSFFKYPDARYIYSSDYNDDADFFYQVLRDEIDNNRPVFYELYGTPGHSVVCDGYDGNLFHLNFGWNGSGNGYFLLEGMMGSYHMKGNAIIGISPSRIWTNKQDSLALVAIYNSTGGSQWVRKNGWLTQPVNTWQGVTVINGRVIKLDLSSNRLSGIIPPETGNLTSLMWLKMSGNTLNGNLPSQIGSLTRLISLEISIAGLTGQIPGEIGNLQKLQKLDLSGNKLSGNLPPGIWGLLNLSSLSLADNLLTGNIPSQVSQLINLKSVNLWKNQLTGAIPQEIGSLRLLTDLVLAGNQFSGSIPETVSGLDSLRDFNISDNLIEGALPDAILNCTKLTGLKISNNKITSIPENIGQLTKLREITAANNLITSLPGTIRNLSELFRLDLTKNLLTTLPDLGAMPALWDLQLSDNRIEALPESFGDFTRLSDLYLGKNLISEIPGSFEKLSRLKVLSLNGNRLRSIPVSFCFLGSLKELYLSENEICNPLPPMNFLGLQSLDIRKNKMVFSDIASSLMPDDTIFTDAYEFSYYDQALVEISDSVFTFMDGDTAKIDIRSLSRLSHKDNRYEWYRDDELLMEGAILTIPHFSDNDAGKYYCRVRNTSYSKVLALETSALELKIKGDDEMDGATVISSRESAGQEFADNIILLQPSTGLRGEVTWQVSVDSITWENVSEQIENASIKESIISTENNKIKIDPKTSLLFRYQLKLENCDPLLSDAVKVNPYGDLLVDTLLNVRDKSVTIAADSIEITIPADFTDSDFRLTVKKLNNPPEAPANRILASAYDVKVSIGSVFEIPLLIKLKNIDKNAIAPENIDRYKAVYFDEEKKEWITYGKSALILQDSTIVFETNHLTKLSWLWDTEVLSGYTDVFIRNNIRVFYKEKDEDFLNSIYGKSQTVQPWHVTSGDPEWGTPLQIQDIAQFLYEVKEAFRALNLPVPDHIFTVYVKEMDDDGNVGLMGLLNHYLNINRDIDSPETLRSLLAHEFMHYTQDNYISSNAGNIFWMEANAHLSDRLVWNEAVIPVSESEKYLLNSRSGNNNIFQFLSNSWDYWDKGMITQNAFGNVNFCYLAGTFLHYMRSYKEGTRLKPEILLKETPYTGSWLEYLDSYATNNLGADIGDQYEAFVKFIVEGSKPVFSLTDTTEGADPLKYLKTAPSEFMTNKFFKFPAVRGKQILKDTISLELPYLSSQMVQMYNINTDKQKALVKYKRTTLKSDKNMVYLCRYDSEARKILYEDISDVDSSAFVIESPAGTNMEKKKHVAWLLFINKDKTEEYKPGYALEVLPVPDISFFDAFYWTIGISPSNAPIHTFMKGTVEELDVFHLMPGVYRDYADVYYSTLYTSVSMTDETISASSHSDWMEQSVSLNFVTGDMTIYEKENWGGITPTSTIDIREMTMVLKNVWLLPGSIDSKQFFSFNTDNSAHTRMVIQSISYTRKFALYNEVRQEHDPVVTTTYIKTNYTDQEGKDIDNIKFHMLFY